MLAKRLIARLDIKAPYLIKPVRLEGYRKVGDPAQFAQKYAEQGIDEILYMDCVASLYGRNSLDSLIEKTTEKVFVPVTVGGGIRNLADVKRAFNSGADKICINTAVLQDPSIIKTIADRYGNQAIVVSIEAKKTSSGWEAYKNCGRDKTGKCAIEWAKEAAYLGAGEILLTSVDHEGMRNGFDCEFISKVAGLDLPIPIIASGGCGSPAHVVHAIQAGADAVAVADILHFGRASIEGIHNEAMKNNIILGHQ